MTPSNTTINGTIRFETSAPSLGIGTATPRLSWTTTAPPAWRQYAYELEVQGQAGSLRTDTTGVITSNEQVLIDWPFAPLASRERADIRVRLHGEDGSVSPWSRWASIEAGLLEASDWVAAPVGGAWPETSGTDRRPSLVRKAFVLPDDIVSARLYASAHGVFEAEVNGTRVGDDILAPGWTSYANRLRYRTYDVTDLLNAGGNVLGAWLGDGWYRGRLGFNGGYHDLYGTDLAFIAQLEVITRDGKRHTIATDASWQAAPSPILFSGLYDGEQHDLRLEEPGWSAPGPDAGGTDGWTPVAVGCLGDADLIAYEQPPIRCTEERSPQSITRLEDGRILLDFGQNMVGRLRIDTRGHQGHSGDTLVLRHAEVIQNGELYRRTLRLAASEDTVTLRDDQPIQWEPRFTIHGFRYAEIEGWSGDFDTDNVSAKVYHTDMRRTGWFDSSDPLLNRLHDNVLWSMRSNFVDIPTDCPQRDERLGWTGDIQVFAPTASYLYDCSGFLSSWLKDLAIEQLDDGTVPWFIPRIPGGPSWEPIKPGAVWGDAAVLTPWVLYQRFADRQVLRNQYASAKAWVDLIVTLAGEDRLWNEGFQLGDWLDPAAPPEDPAAALTDKYLVATAYFALSARHLGYSAHVLGRPDDAAHYAAISDEVRAAFLAEYVHPDGTMTSDAQTAYALAIMFDLLDDQRLQGAGDRLADLVRASGNRIATGFAGTPLVADALTRTGHTDTAYDLLMERQCPSWFYTVLQGGTTIWERWDSMLPDGTVNPGEMTSFNHFALGSIADYMHREIAGITPLEPAYRRVLIRPRPGGGLTHASGQHDSPYGTITSRWCKTDGEYILAVTLPTGTTGVVELPDGTTSDIGPGDHTFSWQTDSPRTVQPELRSA